MYYLKTRDGLEIDLVIELEGKLHLFEIKSSMTITSKHASSLFKMINESGSPIDTAAIISGTEDNFTVKGDVTNYGWKNVSGF